MESFAVENNREHLAIESIRRQEEVQACCADILSDAQASFRGEDVGAVRLARAVRKARRRRPE